MLESLLEKEIFYSYGFSALGYFSRTFAITAMILLEFGL